MVNQMLVTLINSVLGIGKPTARGNYSYNCPFCMKHSKLEIQLVENSKGLNSYHCWHCDKKGKTLSSLFKQIRVSPSKFEELNKIVKSSITYIPKDVVSTQLTLPTEFISLYKSDPDNIMARHALFYLSKRNIDEFDILRYNIGFCDKGKYKNRIIIPSYDSDGTLNYFTGRTFENDNKYKYLNPETSRDIIFNEHLINWNLPLILCEGAFDALAIKRNSLPLLGKNIQKSLMKKIVTSNIKKIYIALDKDAIKKSLNFCERLMAENKEVYLVDLQEKDPSELGFVNFTNFIHSTFPLTYGKLLEKKLNS